MQVDCAESFIKPLEMGLISEKNIERTIKEAVRILKDEVSEMNKKLIDSWMKVLSTCVSRVNIRFVSDNVVKEINELGKQKNQLPKR